MICMWSVAATAALWWLGAGLAAADVAITSDVDRFNILAEAHDGFPHQGFRSSDIAGPVFHVDSWDHNLTDNSGYIFIGSVYGRHRAGPMILDASDLSLVYADQKWENTYYSEPQILNGKPYLTFWEGYHSRGHANGFCLIVDEQYNVKHNVSAVGLNGALADMHEMQVTTDGTVIFTTYFSIPYDCTPWGGPEDGLLMDSGFQEVDVETNELLFEWSASKHFSPNDTSARYNGDFGVSENSGFDFAHINSVQKTKDGNYLVSSRHLHTLAFIDGADGHPIWILGGKNNQFDDLSDGKATGFSWQHDARFYNDHSHITMFDNHGEKTGSCGDDCRTRGLHIEIDVDAMTARLVAEYYHPRHINAGAMGGLQMLENGNVLTAWGYAPAYVEFAPDGTPVMDIQRGSIGGTNVRDMFAYRVTKGNWTGRPTWPPNMAMDTPHGTAENATLYMSWNGATDIDSWAIFTSNKPREIQHYENYLGSVPRTGFESSAALGPDRREKYVAVAAIDKDGEVLGSSLVFDMETRQPVFMPSEIESIHRPDDNTGHISTVAAGGVVVVTACAFFGLFHLRRRRKAREDVEEAKYKPVSSMED